MTIKLQPDCLVGGKLQEFHMKFEKRKIFFSAVIVFLCKKTNEAYVVFNDHHLKLYSCKNVKLEDNNGELYS